ncbi:MAG: recombinase RecA [Elusimicrobiota bacterium]
MKDAGKEVKKDTEKAKALEMAMTQIEKEFGKEAIMRMGEKVAKIKLESISTGSIGLDIATGIGGIPRGRITEIYGPESSGKTTLCLHIIANTQKNGGVAAFIDAEHAMDPIYAKRIGVDVENLLISQPDSGEQGLEISDRLIRSGAVDCIVIDSVAALVPRSEIEGEMGDMQMGSQARLMSQALRKLTSNISKSKTAIVFTNQLRQKIGVMFGNPETTPGGLALKFYASIRLDIRKIETLKQGDVVVGIKTRVKVVKNKVAAPFRNAEFELNPQEGISRTGELLDYGVNENIIEKSGSWFMYKNERVGQGRDNAKKYFVEHPELLDEIERVIREKYNPVVKGDE